MILVTKLYQFTHSFVRKLQTMTKTVFITGTSSGLGKASAKYFAEQGWNVAATMRSPEKETELQQYPKIRIFQLDITKPDQAKQAAAQAIAAFGKIDVVVNNAGMGVYGALELATEQDIDRQFAVNVRGAINVMRAFLPHFRSVGGGMFINISSFMGVLSAVPLGSLYNMSKFALEGLTEGLYYELKPLNIELRLIEQGGSTENNFMSNIVWNTNPDITVYDKLTEKLKHLMETAGGEMLDPSIDIVKQIYALATGESKQFRTLVGKMSNQLMDMRKNMPIEQYLDAMAGQFS